MRKFARRLALSVPPIRRFYDFAIAETRRAGEQHHRADALHSKLSDLSDKCNALVADRSALVTNVDALNAEREALETQLYVLRSDHQRTVARADGLRQELANVRAELARSQEAQRVPQVVAPHIPGVAEFELANAKLLGHLTRGFAGLEAELRAIRRTNPAAVPADEPIGLYLDLLEKTLTGQLVKDAPISPWSKGFDPEIRELGRDWPRHALTMIGSTRMRNIRVLAERVLEAGVPGDFIEAGVWRGGACIFMRGILAAHRVRNRAVWVADSFAGLPPPEPDKHPADEGDAHHTFSELSVSLDEVRANFASFNLLDDLVRFLPGWFEETLTAAPIEQLAILRLDGDMYSSTIQSLDALYSKLAPGGYVIVDDYILAGCRRAVEDFRERHGVTDVLEQIDGAGVYWRKCL